MNLKSFFNELKRRRVFKVASLYIVSSWVIIQVAATILPELDFPDWSLKAVLVLCIIGLPIALLISWAYDIVPDEDTEITKKNKNSDKYFGNKFARIFLIVYSVVALIGLVIGFRYLSNDIPQNQILTNEESRLNDTEITVAVLPFANLSNDVDQEYFSDGLADEIRYMLSKIPSLRVISRTSCMFYKNKNTPLDKISEELGATHILEGSVRKSNDKIKLNLNLTNGKDESMIWSMPSRSYQLKEIFELQEFIAGQVLDELGITLLRPIKDVSIEQYTDDVEVYNQYLKAKKMLDGITPQKFAAIEKIYLDLIEEDEDFLYGYTGLATINLLKGTIWGSLSSKEAKKKASFYLDKAKSIDSNSAAYHYVNGCVQFYLNYDFEYAENELLIAFKGGETWAPAVLSDLYIKKGQIDKSEIMTNYLSKIDPVNVTLAVQEGSNFLFKGNYEKAINKLESALEFTQNYPQYYRILSLAYMYNGNYNKSIETIENGINNIGYRPSFLLSTLAVCKYKQGNMKEFNTLITELSNMFENKLGGDPAFFLAQTYAATNQIEKSLEWLKESYSNKEVELTWLKIDPAFKALQNNPTYKMYLNYLNLGA